MKILPLVLLAALVAAPALAAGGKLAPPRKVESMLGDVGVMANAEDDRCNVVLFEDKAEQGYRIQVDEGCSVFPVMTRVKAWRVYTDGTMSFADATGTDLITFKKGKGYQRLAVKKVDGIERLWSAQESAE